MDTNKKLNKKQVANILAMADPVRDGGQTTTFTIPADAVVVERCFFCGKDMGFTFFVSGNSRLQIAASTKMLAA